MVPLILAAVALTSAGYGVSKGIDAKEKIDKAKRIARRAQREFDEARENLENQRQLTNARLKDYGELKLRIYTTDIKKLLEVIKTCGKSARSVLSHKTNNIETLTKELQSNIDHSLEILSGISTGAISGGLTAMGAYGGVAAFASASTGASIAGLSGAAATNATLAWLGGGSLAAGGLGMAGGTAILGGIIAGPAIAITGLVMDSKAEENLTEAKKNLADAIIKIEKMKASEDHLKSIITRTNELSSVINDISYRFNKNLLQFKNSSSPCDDLALIPTLITLGSSLKNILEISILDENGNNQNPNFDIQLHEAINEIEL